MLSTSDAFKRILKTDYTVEWKAVIAGVTYSSDVLISARTSKDVFESGSGLSVGNCISGQLDLALLKPETAIPKMAEIKLYLKIFNSTEESEWIPKGVYFISTREEEIEDDGIDVIDIHAYDAMMKLEQPAANEGDQSTWPKTDIQALRYAAEKIGVEIDPRTVSLINKGYSVPYVGYGEDGYSLREMVGYIAAMYVGNAVITDEGKLHIISIAAFDQETYLLANEDGDRLVFGSDRIIVGSDNE